MQRAQKWLQSEMQQEQALEGRYSESIVEPFSKRSLVTLLACVMGTCI